MYVQGESGDAPAIIAPKSARAQFQVEATVEERETPVNKPASVQKAEKSANVPIIPLAGYVSELESVTSNLCRVDRVPPVRPLKMKEKLTAEVPFKPYQLLRLRDSVVESDSSILEETAEFRTEIVNG
ncbi:hypothetical protein FRC15_000947 [Serendipita sp. 397]|nr:hypothetical protein FRC15_000947 [Serendipita sp. 397]KAG8790909.1 hypothetical protein FRC16_000658 [Serendipita sp. 398]